MASGWRRRKFDGSGLTQYPPGQHLEKWNRQRVLVTTPGWDDIGQILRSMNVEFKPFRGSYDCEILFVNCGTSDYIDPDALANFVNAGGCVYASDHIDDVIDQAFPGAFRFVGRTGSAGHLAVDIVDPEVREILGDHMIIEFDMGSWARLRECRGEVLLAHADLPIMAYVEQGKGSVFYTSFHNKAQTSEQEKLLLQLLVLKQFSTTTRRTLTQAGRALGLSLDTMRNDVQRMRGG